MEDKETSEEEVGRVEEELVAGVIKEGDKDSGIRVSLGMTRQGDSSRGVRIDVLADTGVRTSLKAAAGAVIETEVFVNGDRSEASLLGEKDTA